MATTKTAKEKPVVATPTAQAQEAKKEPAKAPAKEAVKAPRKALPKLDDTVRVRVRSNQYGNLIFINSRTGDKILWHDVDEVQDITVGDIRNMRTTAASFFKEPWIWIEGIDLDECDDLTEAEMYEALGLTNYFKQAKRPKFLSTVYQWDVDKIKAEVPAMTHNTKQSIALALNTAIRNEELTNLSTIKVWEEVLGLDLDRE